MTLCEHCTSKKISILMPFTCKCGYTQLCTKCRLAEAHNCTYDYKKEGHKILIKNNPIIIKPKIII